MSWASGQPVRLTTKRFVIRSMVPKDINATFLKWQSDRELRAGQNQKPGKVGRDEAFKILRRADNAAVFYLMIGASVAELPVGFFGITADMSDRYAETFVVIGNRDYWGKGTVLEARAALLDFLFDDLGMHKVLGRVHGRNLPSIFNYKAQGFTCEAVLREQLTSATDGSRLDQLVFAILAEEWRAQRGREHP